MNDAKPTTLVSRNATCKRCESANVTWHQSERGKWYLTEIFVVDGEERTDYRDFHSSYCGNPARHDEKQRALTAQEQAEKRNRMKRDEEREQERIQHEAELLEKWLGMTHEQRDAHIAELDRLIRREADGLTMDYMTEYSRSLAKIEGWKAEIVMLTDFEEDLA